MEQRDTFYIAMYVQSTNNTVRNYILNSSPVKRVLQWRLCRRSAKPLILDILSQIMTNEYHSREDLEFILLFVNELQRIDEFLRNKIKRF